MRRERVLGVVAIGVASMQGRVHARSGGDVLAQNKARVAEDDKHEIDPYSPKPADDNNAADALGLEDSVA